MEMKKEINSISPFSPSPFREGKGDGDGRYKTDMQNELPLKENKPEGFQHISELLPAAMERILDRADNPIPDPNDVEASIRWVEANL